MAEEDSSESPLLDALIERPVDSCFTDRSTCAALIEASYCLLLLSLPERARG
jgi:hypothetical protein